MSRDNKIKTAAWLSEQIAKLEKIVPAERLDGLREQLAELEAEIAKNPIATEQWENMKHGVKFHGTEAEFVIGLESQKRNIGRR